ncbi:hypothetical protein CBR_g3566 [Chara braunii]|uniref:Chloride channel protein n=1 Tax=Chara braunii TaxID=69332 RepID=A0A388KFQ5_CHABU|nr:hypothetical protein CBR_g3566 [Chara braunii]|eukprot:GBG68869.1 hypothetical protein CBR_g3566 [Chara braunii]
MPRLDAPPGSNNDSEEGGMQSRLLLPADRHSDCSDDPLSGVHVMAHMESLDYEVVESAVYKEDQTQRGPFDHVIYASLKWTFALLIGAATGFIAFLINVAVENLAGWKFTATFWVMQYSYILSFFVYVLCNGLLVFSSVVIVTYFAPMAAGSGIPEIKGYLNGIDTPGILLFRTLVGKVFGSLGSVAGGLALGKEGPLVHTGACIASLMGQGGSTKYRITWRWLRIFKNDRDQRDLLAVGVAVVGFASSANFARVAIPRDVGDEVGPSESLSKPCNGAVDSEMAGESRVMVLAEKASPKTTVSWDT